ncbi:galectin-5-like [Ruditapes philippinarum]|uniref:galectin-5-like n=1 Tax=Ruditapes philippinarum TaxID=129788 RepID=UPI00295B2D6C|nr:galectin-5-like [Ruditapes philippinarum]
MATVQAPFIYSKTIYNPTTPFEHKFGCLYPGKVFSISGIPFEDAKRFTVDVRNEKDIAFHFDVRIHGDNTDKIVRNTKKNKTSGWGVEERYLNGPCPFIRDKFFEMVILVDNSCYKVMVNGESVVEYKHRIAIDEVNRIEVKGDVRVTKVGIQE